MRISKPLKRGGLNYIQYACVEVLISIRIYLLAESCTTQWEAPSEKHELWHSTYKQDL